MLMPWPQRAKADEEEAAEKIWPYAYTPQSSFQVILAHRHFFIEETASSVLTMQEQRNIDAALRDLLTKNKSKQYSWM